MLDHLCSLAGAEGVKDRIVVVHADLGRVEWEGVPELAREQADHYGVRFIMVSRPQGDLLDDIEHRGKFPDAARRYCTAHHKRDQVAKVLTMLTDETRDARAEAKLEPRPARILSCMGMRADESPMRAKKEPFRSPGPASNGRRTVDEWLPLRDWTKADVWQRIRESGVRYHPAYDKGMARLSCCFCVLAGRKDLVTAARLNPKLAAEYARVEAKIDHRFRNDLTMGTIIEEAKL